MANYEISDRRPIADLFREIAHGPTRWCVKANIHPNTISYASIVASFGAMICFAFSSGATLPLLAGVGFCFLRLYFNMLDGMVAIAANKTSAIGEIANELPDRISDVLIFLGIGFSQLVHADAAWTVAILCLLVAYIGTLGKASGAHRDFSGPMSKPWRMVALAVGVLAFVLFGCLSGTSFGTSAALLRPYVLDATLIFIAVGCVVTTFVRLKRIVGALSSQQTRS